MNLGLRILVATLALSCLRAESGGCDSSIVGDPTMDLWCGKELCAWTVELGQIQRVATWHRSDYGVGLVGPKVVLSQLSRSSLYSTDCLEFRLQADHADGVQLFVEMDYHDDGTVDLSRPIGSDDYVPELVHLRPSLTAHDVKFRVRKEGAGAATLAEVKIKKVGGDLCQ